MRIVVIGATGNVGTAVLKRLASQPEVSSIVGVARRAPDATVEPYAGVEWKLIDIGTKRSVETLTEAMRGADAVVQLAWLMQPNHHEEILRRTNVEGSEHVLRAVVQAGVPHVVVASSVGAYSPGPKDERVGESWATEGVSTSHYSRNKVEVERMLDEFEADNPSVVVSRLRPGLIFQSGAGKEMHGLFLGPLFSLKPLLAAHLPFLPFPKELMVQAVHADDVAAAYWLVLRARARGAFNVAAEPELGPEEFARAFRAKRPKAMSLGFLRSLVKWSWRTYMQRTDVGWLDIATQVPLISTQRLRTELGWVPRISATKALGEIVQAVAEKRGVAASPPLWPS